LHCSFPAACKTDGRCLFITAPFYQKIYCKAISYLQTKQLNFLDFCLLLRYSNINIRSYYGIKLPMNQTNEGG